MDLCIRPGRALRGQARMPGDKSIAHRALIAAALAEGTSTIRGFDPFDDALRTLEALRACGVQIEAGGERELRVTGRGLRGLASPAGMVDCGQSGTTMRLLAGVLAGQPVSATLDGAEGLRRRPMGRVTEPLARMGARIEGPTLGRYAPFTVHGGSLRGIDYTLSVASAQVKSAILLAALNAEGETVLREPAPSRDHTERLLRRLGVPLEVGDGAIRCRPARPWQGLTMELPGDVSSAAFFLVAATLVDGSEVSIRDVGLNPTRTGVIDVLRAMGGAVEVAARAAGPAEEPVGDLSVRGAELRGVEIGGALIPSLIDELPVLAVAATQARGTTAVRDAAELRVKETDRIAALAAAIETTPDGFLISGPTPLRGARVDAHGDHRTAMALAVAGLVAEGETVVAGAEAIGKSFPAFVATLRALGARCEGRTQHATRNTQHAIRNT